MAALSHPCFEGVGEEELSDVIGLLEDCDRFCEFLGLRRLPHFTTLHKFAQRVTTTLLEQVIAGFIRATIQVGKLVLGVNSSGFKPTKASFFYITVIKGG